MHVPVHLLAFYYYGDFFVMSGDDNEIGQHNDVDNRVHHYQLCAICFKLFVSCLCIISLCV